ncbi:hypothetical protein NDU88_006599 [Pleurodeles waltl]|uniref:Uncharacterized protein n=1 Tax=Pleurodeles waltl TaxID=8319 RepID=A0AAV7PJA1_PLEWA|nr:hypothetical protein NDU88_006599 [Pleurodeles waltl]
MDLNALFTSKAEYALSRMKGCHYEHRVAQLHQQEAVLPIRNIGFSTGDILTHLQAIANEFAAFYRSLYIPKTMEDSVSLSEFLTDIHLPSINDDGRSLLEGEISKGETAQTISRLSYQKSLGEDEFPPEFYK